MGKKRDFGDGMIFTITNYVWWFLMSNFYFWILNIFFIFVAAAMLMANEFSMNWLCALSLLPMFPAFTALLGTMGKLLRDKSLTVTKDFFKAYRQSFFDALFLGAAELIILTILWVDILYFNGKPQYGALHYVPKALFVICLGLNFYVFPILSRFHLKKIQLLKLSLKYMVKKVHICLTAFAAMYLLFFVFSKANTLLVLLFWAGLVSYLVMFLSRGMLDEIEASLQK